MNDIYFRLLTGATVVLFGAAACSASSVSGVPVAPMRATSPSSKHVTIEELKDLPRGSYNAYFPTALTRRGNAIWVADDIDQDAGQDAIVRISASGKRTKAVLYQADSSPSLEGIAAGPDGALWVTDAGDGQILRVTTAGTITAYPLGAYGGGYPQGIVAGSDGALWFADNGSEGSIGRITVAGTITTYSEGISPNAYVQGITTGPDGAIWFTEPFKNRIGRITVSGAATEYSAGITSGSEPYSIVTGPDGALWFTELQGGRIGRITSSGKVTEFSRGIPRMENPYGIAAGSDGALWFTESQGVYYNRSTDAQIGRITTKGKVTNYLVPTSNSGPTGIVDGPDGKMWFVETNANKMGRVDF